MVSSKILSYLLFVLWTIECLGANRSRWEEEINTALKRNIVGCRYEISAMLPGGTVQLPSTSNHLIAHYLYPSKADMAAAKMLPITLTQADSDLKANANRSGYTFESWAAQKESRWEVPITHPGQDRINCVNMTYLAASEQIISYYETFKHIKRGFYVLYGKNAFIHPSGAVGFSCGFFIGREACENRWNYAKDWYLPCRDKMNSSGWDWQDFWASPSRHSLSDINAMVQKCGDLSDLGSSDNKNFIASRHDKVFTIPALWDYNYHHFLADSLARMVHHLRFIRTNKDVMIHVRAFEEYDHNYKSKQVQEGARKMRFDILDLLGIDRSRIIHGPVLANEVYIPRFLRCSYLLSNPVEIQLLAKQLVHAAFAKQSLRKPSWPLKPPVGNRTLVIQQRHGHHSDYRHWTDQTTDLVVAAFRKAFPEHQIVLHSSKNLKKRSLAEEIVMYSQADILVGLHGAGFTSMMFMPPNALIVEMVGRVVDVNMPVCGYYGPMAAACGHHHYIHSFDVNTGNVREEVAAQKVAAFYKTIHDPTSTTPVLRLYDSLKEVNQ